MWPQRRHTVTRKNQVGNACWVTTKYITITAHLCYGIVTCLIAAVHILSLLAAFTKNQMIPELGFDRLRGHLPNLHVCNGLLHSTAWHARAQHRQDDSLDTASNTSRDKKCIASLQRQSPVQIWTAYHPAVETIWECTGKAADCSWAFWMQWAHAPIKQCHHEALTPYGDTFTMSICSMTCNDSLTCRGHVNAIRANSMKKKEKRMERKGELSPPAWKQHLQKPLQPPAVSSSPDHRPA